MREAIWTVSQHGGREHYAVPVAFARRTCLRQFYTDVWCPPVASWLSRGPAALRALAKRSHREIDSKLVKSFPIVEVHRQLRHRFLGAPRSNSDLYAEHLIIANALDRRVRDHMQRQTHDPDRDAFFGFTSASLLSLELCKDRGIRSVVDQVDAGRMEEEIVLEEGRRWQGWEGLPGLIPEAFWEKCRREWEVATLVLVNSNWSRKALLREGVADEKVIVVPLAYEPDTCTERKNINRTGPLRILWLGTVNLRKGIPYLFEAARQVTDRKIEVTIAGPVHIAEEAVKTAPANMQFIGRVTLDRINEVYDHADVFALPTVSDGFALTQLEAMARGLPVIVTPNCGEVVTDGIDGFIVPARDGQALAQAIVRLDEDRSLLESMSRAALEKSRTFTIDRYGASVEEAVAKVKRPQPLQQVGGS